MKSIKTLALAFGAMSLTFCGNANTKNNETATEPEQTETVTAEETAVDNPTIVGVAAGNENFSTLVAAVKAAGLVDVLNGDGPFTVFAPTNAAFDALPEGTVATLLKPENKGQLTAVLTYHVVAGKFEAAAVLDAIKANNGAFTVTTVQGGTITLSTEGGKVILTDAKGRKATVAIPDVAASNGVIHAIDTVVLPE